MSDTSASTPSSHFSTIPAKAGEAALPGELRSSQELPSYSRSLLRIRVPVRVTLASKKLLVSSIVELGQGSLIQFDKPCEELLELEVGGQKIALGEAVKVGDKFGLRLSSVVLPEERFVSIASKR